MRDVASTDRPLRPRQDAITALAGGPRPATRTGIPLYRAVRFLGSSGCVDRLAEFADDEDAAFAAWVDAAMDRRLAAVDP